MRRTFYFLLFIIFFSVSGCAKLAYMDQLLTLKGLADEQVRVSKYIEAQDQKFEMLLESAKSGQLSLQYDQTSIMEVYGEPVYVNTGDYGDLSVERWLYRYSTQFFDSPKVYLYFNAQGELLKFEAL